MTIHKGGLAGAGLSLLVLASGLSPAMAQPVRHHHHRHREWSRCEAAHHRSANTGTVLGAVAGGILGSQLAGRGSRTLGTVLGAGGGAVLGHQVGAHAHRC